VSPIPRTKDEEAKFMKIKVKLAGNNPKKDRRTDKGIAKGPTKGFHTGKGK
jgi:hypothetical protein